MGFGAVESEIGNLFALAVDLGPHADKIRHQRIVGQARPIAADLTLKFRAARAGCVIEVVRHVIGPLDVRAEFGTAGNVEGQMYP